MVTQFTKIISVLYMATKLDIKSVKNLLRFHKSEFEQVQRLGFVCNYARGLMYYVIVPPDFIKTPLSDSTVRLPFTKSISRVIPSGMTRTVVLNNYTT